MSGGAAAGGVGLQGMSRVVPGGSVAAPPLGRAPLGQASRFGRLAQFGMGMMGQGGGGGGGGGGGDQSDNAAQGGGFGRHKF